MRVQTVSACFIVLAVCVPDGVEACCHISPLVLDVENDGIATTDLRFGSVQFDLDGDGDLDSTSWIATDALDGFLCLDLNGNGTIDSGRELFGDFSETPDGSKASNGFEALKMYDDSRYGGNGDSMVSERDFIWSHLLLWFDFNHNGRSEEEELQSLAIWGIRWIHLRYQTLNKPRYDGNLNIFRHFSLFARDRGSRTLVSKVWDMYPDAPGIEP